MAVCTVRCRRSKTWLHGHSHIHRCTQLHTHSCTHTHTHRESERERERERERDREKYREIRKQIHTNRERHRFTHIHIHSYASLGIHVACLAPCLSYRRHMFVVVVDPQHSSCSPSVLLVNTHSAFLWRSYACCLAIASFRLWAQSASAVTVTVVTSNPSALQVHLSPWSHRSPAGSMALPAPLSPLLKREHIHGAAATLGRESAGISE